MKKSIREQLLNEAVTLIRNEIRCAGVTEIEVARSLGIANSTFNSFLNGKYRKPNENTLRKIARAPFWSPETSNALVKIFAKTTDVYYQLSRSNSSASRGCTPSNGAEV